MSWGFVLLVIPVIKKKKLVNSLIIDYIWKSIT